MANPIRTGLKNLHCINSVFCGDQIEAVWANSVRDLGQSSFERGDTVMSLCSHAIGTVKVPIVGFCWNMVQNYDNNPERLILWRLESDYIRFQPAYPHYHNVQDLYQAVQGSDPFAPNYGTPTTIDSIEGYQHTLPDFENAGYTKGQIIARVRRGEKYSDFNAGKIVETASDLKIYEFKDDSGFGDLAYRQHIQCWYCQENPSGSMFPPLKVLVFDDTDCPVQVQTRIVKEFNLPLTPIAGETTLDWIVIAIWYEVPFGGYFATLARF